MTETGFIGPGRNVAAVLKRDGSAEAQSTNRASTTRSQSKYFWHKVVDFLDITSGFRVPKEIQKGGFLEQLWKQGAHYSSTAAFRALVHQTANGPPLTFDGLTPYQAARLRENFLRHPELARAITSGLEEIGNYKDPPSEVKELLDGLQENLKTTFAETSRISRETSEGLRTSTSQRSKFIQAQISAKLVSAIQAKLSGTAGETDFAVLVQGRLSEIDGKQAPAIHRYKKDEVQDLYAYCVSKAGRKSSIKEAKEFAARFMNAPSSKQDEVWELLRNATSEHVTQAGASQAIDDALNLILGVREPWTIASLPQIGSAEEAKAALEEIAEGINQSPDEDFRSAVANGLAEVVWSEKHAKHFLKHADRAALQGRPAVIREMVRGHFRLPPRIHSAGIRKGIIDNHASTGVIKEQDFMDLLKAAIANADIESSPERLNYKRFMEAPLTTRDVVLNNLSLAIDDSLGAAEFFVGDAARRLTDNEQE